LKKTSWRISASQKIGIETPTTAKPRIAWSAGLPRCRAAAIANYVRIKDDYAAGIDVPKLERLKNATRDPRNVRFEPRVSKRPLPADRGTFNGSMPVGAENGIRPCKASFQAPVKTA
jgi:hypothetical protein